MGDALGRRTFDLVFKESGSIYAFFQKHPLLNTVYKNRIWDVDMFSFVVKANLIELLLIAAYCFWFLMLREMCLFSAENRYISPYILAGPGELWNGLLN